MDLCALRHRRWYPRCAISPTLSIGRDAVDLPLKWRTPTHVFVLPGDDLFARPTSFVEAVAATMHAAHWHEFQLTTGLPDVVAQFVARCGWPPNAWLGYPVNNPADADRVPEFTRLAVPVRFLHLRCVPALAAGDLEAVSFVMVEGRPPEVERLRVRCEAAGVRLFVGERPERAELIAGPRTAIVPAAPRTPFRAR